MEGVVTDPGAWRGRRVFLTGHTGFKGSWLALCLRRLGAEVTGYALDPPTVPSLFQAARVGGALKDVRGDVRDPESLREALSASRPDVVFHLAAQPLVLPSLADPAGTYATNVMGTVNVLEAIRRTDGVRAAVVVTSDKCYENPETDRPQREGDPMGGLDPYSSSKGCAELVVAAYRSSYFVDGMAVASARAGNAVGGGDWARDRLVPDAIRAFAAERAVEIRNPGAIRPWQHVLEPLRGYLLLAERLLSGEVGAASGWNFGPNAEDAWPVSEVVDRLAALWGGGAAWRPGEASPRREARQLRLDCSKARDRLGWAPRLPLDAALAWTVEWYRSWHEGGDVALTTQAQIERYFAAAP